MLALIKKTDPRILALAFITFVLVGFSVFMALNALADKEPSPEYLRTPPKAFAIPIAETIVSEQAITESRLPDKGYIEVNEKSKYLSKKIAAQKLSLQDLASAGMSTPAAENTLSQVSEYYKIYKGRHTFVEAGVVLGSVNVNAAETSQSVQFEASKSGAPGGAFTIKYVFSGDSEGSWNIETVEIIYS